MSFVDIDIDFDLFDAASATIGTKVAGGIETAYTELLFGLSGTHAMAGTDSSGHSWGTSYDASTGNAVEALKNLYAGSLRLASMLELTGFNHGAADRSSDPGHRAGARDTTDYRGEPGLASCLSVPSAVGGSGDSPTGWDWVCSQVGFDWPDGKVDAVATAATAWSAAQSALTALTTDVDDALLSISFQRSPEVDDATTMCSLLKTHLSSAAGVCGKVAKMCTDQAAALDKARNNALSVLKALVAASVVTQAVGALVALFSFGFGEGGAQTMEAAEIAAAAGEINGYLATLSTETGSVVLYVSDVDSEVLAIQRFVQPILDTDLVTADTETVQSLEAAGVSKTEAEAEVGLKLAAKVRDPANLPSKWGSQARLDKHFYDHGSDFGATSTADYSAKAKAFFARFQREGIPAKVDQSGTVRVFDASTRTFGSYGADGTIKTFLRASSATYLDRQPGVLI